MIDTGLKCGTFFETISKKVSPILQPMETLPAVAALQIPPELNIKTHFSSKMQKEENVFEAFFLDTNITTANDVF